MVIDFHTHIFPDKIAGRTLSKLTSVMHLVPSMNGTITGLLESMERSGVDISVVLPIVTNPHQFDSILRFASCINESSAGSHHHGLISMASVHPAEEHYKDQLRLIKKEGIRGIKLHPNYQGVSFDDIRYMRIIDTASELGLVTITHAGFDAITPHELFCTPDMIHHVLNEVAPEKLVLAHMGSNEQYDEVEEILCGRQVFFDTSYSILHMSEEQFVRIVKRHGADKILFGTDAPWTFQKGCIERLHVIKGLTEEEKQKIFSGNASTLLGL